MAAGRWVSVLAGLASMIGLFCIGRDMFNRTVGFLAGLLYIVVPYTFFFDRLAIPAALLTALGVWMMRWSLHIAQDTRPRNRAFKILGILIGAGFLVKTTAWLLLAPHAGHRPELFQRLQERAKTRMADVRV